MALSHADRARLAHRVLRLVENRVDSEKGLKKLAAVAAPPRGGEQQVGVPGHPLAQIAGRVADARDPDRPGPTDQKLVDRLFGRSVEDLFKEWDAATLANLEQHHPDSLKAAQKSWERDQKAYDDQVAAMLETGEFPSHPAFGHNRAPNLANSLYDEGRAGFLAGEIDWDTATIKAVLVDSADYTVNLGTHKFLSSVPSAGREETSAALATKTVTAGVADADDTSWPSAAGDPCEAVILVQSSAVGGGADVADTAQRLIGYIDTATGLPVILNGGTVNLVFDSGSNRIFKL